MNEVQNLFHVLHRCYSSGTKVVKDHLNKAKRNSDASRQANAPDANKSFIYKGRQRSRSSSPWTHQPFDYGRWQSVQCATETKSTEKY